MIEARDALVAAGHRSEIFAGDVDPRWAAEGARHYQEYGRAVPARPDDRLVYQVAIGSPVADWLVDRSETLIANHHNFTPMRFLQAWDPTATHGVVWGRRQLQRLAGRCALGIADSRFNQLDLEAAGFTESVVVPVLVDLAASRSRCRRRAARNGCATRRPTAAATGSSSAGSRRTSASTISSPRSRRTAARTDRRTRLHLVGGSTSPTYSFALERFVAELGLEDAVEITGPVSAAALGCVLPRRPTCSCA